MDAAISRLPAGKEPSSCLPGNSAASRSPGCNLTRAYPSFSGRSRGPVGTDLFSERAVTGRQEAPGNRRGAPSDLVAALAAIAQAVTGGVLTPDEGHAGAEQGDAAARIIGHRVMKLERDAVSSAAVQ